MTGIIVKKRSVQIGGVKTSISLEDEFWDRLRGIAHGNKITMGKLISGIKRKPGQGLSSAIRVQCLMEAHR